MSNQKDDKDKIDSAGSREIVSQKSEDNKEKKEPKDIKLGEELDLEGLPEEAQAVMKMVLSRSISARSSSLSNPLSEKINTEHISKMLDIAEQDNEREFEDTKLSKLYNLITLIIILVFLGFITVFLGNKDLSTYQDIIRILIIFGGGFGAGYGYKSRIK